MAATGADHRDASRIATQAGRLLVGLRNRVDDPSVDFAALRDEADRRSHDLILDELARAHPGDAVLSEEGADDQARLAAERTWIIDPLDGTREFGEPGRSDWAVHVALVVDGRPVAGAVALPARELTLGTDPAPPPPPGTDGPPRVLVSRTRPPAIATDLAAELGGELVPMGSAGAKAMAVVLGEADIYAHGGGQYEWDSAAPVAVAAAAGLHVSRLDGSPLRYNQPNPWLPDLLVCRPELADAVLAALDVVGSA
jgi:3'(2'), 5'-bisphosphate nucleotidase